jgi:hypothetical protein
MEGDADKSSERRHLPNNGDRKDWHWGITDIKFDYPHYGGMMCCVRFSRNMFKCIDTYAKKHNTLFFLEPMFPTIAIRNNLKYNTPKEFDTIYFQHDFKKEDIDMKGLYHPVKDMNKHVEFRSSTSSS